MHPQAPALGRQGEVQEAAAGPELGQPESEVTAVVAPLKMHPSDKLSLVVITIFTMLIADWITDNSYQEVCAGRGCAGDWWLDHCSSALGRGKEFVKCLSAKLVLVLVLGLVLSKYLPNSWNVAEEGEIRRGERETRLGTDTGTNAASGVSNQ